MRKCELNKGAQQTLPPFFYLHTDLKCNMVRRRSDLIFGVCEGALDATNHVASYWLSVVGTH